VRADYLWVHRLFSLLYLCGLRNLEVVYDTIGGPFYRRDRNTPGADIGALTPTNGGLAHGQQRGGFAACAGQPWARAGLVAERVA
jgi:hypothetical protein